jgi:demethylmenaquinone methyltransferase/2-methoxy-6-polyprenyl-1,4-benzoquinol methylase
MNQTTRRSKKSNGNGYTLPSIEDKSSYVRENFNEIASRYDLFNDAITFGFHRIWKRMMVKRASVGENGFHLDLCSGTGDIALMAARMTPPSARVMALDFSPGMLEVLKTRLGSVPESIKGKIDLKEGDASDLSFLPDSSVDGITIGFGLRNIADRAKALREMHRVLKPGGHVVILDVGQVPIPLVNFFHKMYFEKVVPIIGFLIHGEKHEMYEYLPASAKVYPDQKKLKKEMEDTGFQNVRYKNLFLGSAALHTGERAK